MSGYARIHRQVLDHAAFRNEAEAHAFIGLVLRASWKPVRVRYKGKSVDLKRGQLAVSVRDLAEALDRDKGWVERVLKRLRDHQMIETVRGAASLIVTICNYDKYQYANDDAETVGETVKKTDVRQTQDTEQVREIREEKKDISEAKASSPVLRPEHVVDAWNDMAVRCGLARARLTPTRQRSLAVRLRQHPIEDWTEAIDAVERNSWMHGANDKGWRADFDFLLQPKSFIRLIEGSYDRTSHAS